MVQAVNTKAIFTLASVIRRPSLMIPHVSVKTVSELDFSAIRQSGNIRAIIFDKDNTLTAPYAPDIHPHATKGLEFALSEFGQANVAILSNSAGTLDDPDHRDAQNLEQTLGIPVIRHDEKKPGGLKEVMQHFDLEEPCSLCVVGDRILTDIVFGNLHGMLTVHTLPFDDGYQKDNWTAKLVRPFENKLVYGRLGKWMLPQSPKHKFWNGADRSPLTLPPDR